MIRLDQMLKKFIISGLFVISSCSDNQTSQSLPKPPFNNLDDCILFIDNLDAKRGYPPREKDSVIYECENNPSLIAPNS